MTRGSSPAAERLELLTMPHARMMRSIELFGTVVAPAVRREVASRVAASA